MNTENIKLTENSRDDENNTAANVSKELAD